MRDPLRYMLLAWVFVGASCRCTERSLRRTVAGIVRDDPPAQAPVEPPTPAAPTTAPSIGECPVLPPDSPWNRDVSGDPVDPRSAAYIANIAAHGPTELHPDFGSSARNGIPYVVVPATQPGLPVTFTEYGGESDQAPYPIPARPLIEAGRDRHILIVQTGTCRLFELYHVQRTDSQWSAGAGAVFDLRANTRRPRGWTSCDQAGMPIFPGLARASEVARGSILHALRVTFDHTQDAWIAPANHPGGVHDVDAPPMGLRLRLKASYDLTDFTGQSRVILTALKRYGLLVADTGSNWFVSGAPDPRWDDDDLDQLARVPGSAFEVVQTAELQRRRR